MSGTGGTRKWNLRRYLVAGVLVWLPILATVWVVRFVIEAMDQTLVLLPPHYRPEALFGFTVPGLGILFAFVLLLLTGLAVTNLIGRHLVEYPRAGIWSLGFITADDVAEVSAKIGEPQICVFICAAPNPTSGFIIFVPRSQVIELQMSVDAAMKMIVTCGVVVPHHPAAHGVHGDAAGAIR